MYKNILIIVVLYETDIYQHWLLKFINELDQRISVVYFDNSKNSQCFYPHGRIFYIHNKKNVGVSKSYNMGFDLAKKLGKDFVLLLDQDTKFSFSAIDKMLNAANLYGEQYIYAPVMKGKKIYSPFIERLGVGKPVRLKKLKFNQPIDFKRLCIINSGTLIPIGIYEKVGKFNEKLPLDFSDIYFFNKCRCNNIKLVLVNAVFEHFCSGDDNLPLVSTINRFRFFCCGARVYIKSGRVGVFWALLRRMLVIMVKYRTVLPVLVVKNYFFQENQS